MAWWLTVYPTRPLTALTAAELQARLAAEDFARLAGWFDFDGAQAEAAASALRVVARSAEPLDVAIHYHADAERRPIVLHRWHEPARIAEELEECRDVRDPPEEVAARLDRTVEIVAIELGLSMLEDMGLPLAYRLGHILSELGAGPYVDDDNQWFENRGGDVVRLSPEPDDSDDN